VLHIHSSVTSAVWFEDLTAFYCMYCPSDTVLFLYITLIGFVLC
jgi:hypothetical protein